MVRDDSRIIQLFFSRDEKAIAQTDLYYGAYCRTIARNIVKNDSDAEECAAVSVNNDYFDILISPDGYDYVIQVKCSDEKSLAKYLKFFSAPFDNFNTACYENRNYSFYDTSDTGIMIKKGYEYHSPVCLYTDELELFIGTRIPSETRIPLDE